MYTGVLKKTAEKRRKRGPNPNEGDGLEFLFVDVLIVKAKFIKVKIVPNIILQSK